jgi:hypothetical protein
MFQDAQNSPKPTIEKKIFGDPVKDTSPSALRELLEKNLKWSQIIYEQNRRLNGRLVWSLIANWLRLSIILVPLILGVLFLPNIFKNLRNTYGFLFNPVGTSGVASSTPSAEEIIKLINNLDTKQKAELNKLLK